MRAVRKMQERTALAKQTVTAKRGKEAATSKPQLSAPQKMETGGRLGGIHKPELRAGSGDKYELHAALSRFATDQARRSAEAARKEQRPSKKKAEAAGARRVKPLEQILRELPAEGAQAAGDSAQKAAETPAARRRRRKGPSRRLRRQATAVPVAAGGGGGNELHRQPAQTARRKSAASPQQGAVASGKTAGTPRRRKSTGLPPQIKLHAGRCLQAKPWRG